MSPRTLALGVSGGWLIAVWVTLSQMGTPVDAACYYRVDVDHPYAGQCFAYAPPVAQLMHAIIATVPFDVFAGALRAIELLILAVLAGPAAWLATLLPPVAAELTAANINLILVAAVLAGFRRPWLWSIVLLTKATIGIGLLWFPVRREWRQLGIALGATAAIVLVSMVTAPELWPQYVGRLLAEGDSDFWTIGKRLPIATIIVIWAAKTDRRWAVVLGAVFVAMPRWYFLTPVVLVGLLPLVRVWSRAELRASLARRSRWIPVLSPAAQGRPGAEWLAIADWRTDPRLQPEPIDEGGVAVGR